jgi:hypothetical protein
MSKRTTSKASLNEVLSAIGVASAGIDALMRRGIDRDQWSRLSSDPAFADRVAAVMLDGTGSSANISIEQLVAAAKSSGALNYISDNITSANFKEVGVRGELVLVDLRLKGWFSTQKALDTLDALGYRPATMYGGVQYAGSGWDRKTPVGILGSVWRDSHGYDHIGYLGYNGADRGLYVNCVDDDWHDSYRFLAVRK